MIKVGDTLGTENSYDDLGKEAHLNLVTADVEMSVSCEEDCLKAAAGAEEKSFIKK